MPMAKIVKKCYRSVSGDNFEPVNCIKELCAAWVRIDQLEGCSFVLEAVTSIINNIGDKECKGTQETADEHSKDNTQCRTGGTDDIEEGGKENNDCNPTKEDAIEQIDRSEVPKEDVIKPITSGATSMLPIDSGEYKGDPA